MAYVYQHIRLDKNEVFYVGIGSDNTGKRAYKINGRTKFWMNIINKTKYNVVILKNNITWEEACLLEKRLIFFYGRKDLGTGSLVNLTDGGEGMSGYKMTEDQKTFHKNTFAKYRNKSNEINRKLRIGTKLPQYVIDKLKGRKLSEQSKNIIRQKVSKPVELYDLDGNFLMEFNSILEASKYFNIAPTGITNNINKLSKQTKQGIWKLK